MRRTASVILASSLALAAAVPVSASLFKPAREELVYTGAAQGVTEGVLVIRDQEALKQALEPLDPAYGGPPIDLDKRTILRVVGRARENGCRDTALLEASTKLSKTTLKLEERVPDKDCACTAMARPSKVYLLSVDRAVRTAEILKTDRVIPCPEAATVQEKTVASPVQIFEGAWDSEPGAKVIVDKDAYREVFTKLGFPDRAPSIDFEKERVVTVTGRSRENACRKTSVVDAKVVSPEEVTFEVEETYSATGQKCGQTFMRPRLFVYRVPATVMRARVVTKEIR